MAGKPQFDALVIGGGPAGATAAIVLARKGRSVIVLEKDQFPRFHIGESFLPASFTLMKKLGLDSVLEQVSHVPKFGAEFGMGGADEGTIFDFDESFAGRRFNTKTFNLERAPFDAAVLDEARKAGAEVRCGCAVRRIERLEEGRVEVTTDDGAISAHYLIDASGLGCVAARHLGQRQKIDQPHLRKAAYYAHFENVFRHEGRQAGHPTVAMCEDSWFWMIPLNDRLTSVGLVMDVNAARQVDCRPERMLAWGIERCPLVRGRMKNATGPDTNHVAADYTYTCAPFAGPGYFLIGDAATFLDPVFSTGVHLGFWSGELAGELIEQVITGRIAPPKARSVYIRRFKKMTSMYFRMIRYFYDHSFRELFLEGHGPMQMHRAVLGVLTGNVVPDPPWFVRWRLMAFALAMKLQGPFKLVPRKPHFRLLDQPDPPSRPADVQTPVAMPVAVDPTS